MNDVTLESPSLLRRLAAIIYDTFLVLPLIMVTVALALGLRAALAPEAHDDTQVMILSATFVQVIALIAVIAFFSYFWLKNGQTLSMQAWRIKLVSCSGDSLQFHQLIIRCLAALLSAVCLGAGYWWCLFDAQGRTWHDRLSGTQLLLLPKKDKKKKV